MCTLLIINHKSAYMRNKIIALNLYSALEGNYYLIGWWRRSWWRLISGTDPSDLSEDWLVQNDLGLNLTFSLHTPTVVICCWCCCSGRRLVGFRTAKLQLWRTRSGTCMMRDRKTRKRTLTDLQAKKSQLVRQARLEFMVDRVVPVRYIWKNKNIQCTLHHPDSTPSKAFS